MFVCDKLLGFVFVVALIQSNNVAAKQWWETASFYQIYPRSFKDSNGDGVGDLKGITEKLEYLKEIGITATWLSPIFLSPMADFGYDIRNFTVIDPTFGTMEDFEALLEKAKHIGVKIILDFVPNHSSDECEWFLKSAERDPEYENFYIWHPGKIIDGERQPPTNWISIFRGSQWTWHEGRQEYYLHQFHHKQPDLNYRNPKVKETMKDVLRFWLRKGIAGFRVDAVPFLFEIAPDENGNLPDEPRNENSEDPLDSDYLDHIYTQNQPETIEMVYEFRAVLDEMKAKLGSDDLILLTEAYAPLDVTMQYYGNETMEGAQIPFNFQLINDLSEDSDASYYVELIQRWLLNTPLGKTSNWVLGNHDQKRVGSRLGADRINLLNMLLLTLPGCSITYNGEEIGMTDVWISWEDTVDPQACQANREDYEQKSRDPARTPFQWNDARYAGFTNGESTWLPVADSYKSVNVKRERSFTHSHLNVYKKLQKLRSRITMQNGDTDVQALNSNVVAIKRSYNGQPTFVVLLNIMDHIETVNLQKVFDGLSDTMIYEVVTEKSIRREGQETKSNSVLLLPKEAVVLRSL